MNISIECKFFTLTNHLHTFIQKKVEAYKKSDFYFYSKFYPHKLDIKLLTNEHESDDELIYEF